MVVCVSNSNVTPRKKLKVRWWHILLIAVTCVCFLGLAYWQWTRFQSGSGTFQNLGYAFQWPLFAAFVIYAYKTAMRYENERIEAENEAAEMSQAAGEQGAGATAYRYEAPTETQSVKKIDEDFLPQRSAMSVEEFNELNKPRRGQHG
ncbi:hypothetical protein [Corynebacterium endometrii]|uniref:Lipoprotein LprD n=1 Tax=Corynebacterium endometrii TaxID=2488819 RepID=A0A4P7QJ07_9CORY|nr:hypothetical protein [Corynebacterium endometrii]QCB29086.1 hypothetical protein CENDO_09110 [Corynebacterium endometrii]